MKWEIQSLIVSLCFCLPVNSDETKASLVDQGDLLLGDGWSEVLRSSAREIQRTEGSRPVVMVYCKSSLGIDEDSLLLITPKASDGVDPFDSKAFSDLKFDVSFKDFKDGSNNRLRKIKVDKRDVMKLWTAASTICSSVIAGHTEGPSYRGELVSGSSYYIFSSYCRGDQTKFVPHMSAFISVEDQGHQDKIFIELYHKIVTN